jgi:hypothetical protein
MRRVIAGDRAAYPAAQNVEVAEQVEDLMAHRLVGKTRRRIAAVLREEMAAVEQARAAVEEELQTINALPAALLRRAFSGEI